MYRAGEEWRQMAKQNGVKYTTISATGTMTQIDWRRLLSGHGDEVVI